MENEQEQQELWWAPLYVKDADIACSIKTAVLDYVDKREDQSTPTPYLKQLRTLILSQEWIRGISLKTSPETELNKIQKVIDQHKTYHAVLAALTEWEKDFSAERKQHDQPEYTPEYLRQQRENYDMVKWLGPQVIHSSICDFGASISFYDYISNRQAIIWLQNLITIKANAPIAIPAPEKPETESQTPTLHTGNTSTQHQEQPTHTASSRAEMSQYKPSDWELIDELCNARESNWELAYVLHNRWNHGESSVYSEYSTYLKGVAINFPAIPLLHMLTPTEWREKPITFILNQIQTSPQEYRNTIKNILDRYRIAARKMLTDIAYNEWIESPKDSQQDITLQKRYEKLRDSLNLDNSDIPPPKIKYDAPEKNGEPGGSYNVVTIHHFLDQHIEEAQLVKKVITLQELQKLIDKEAQQQPQPTPHEPIDQQTEDIVKTYHLNINDVMLNMINASGACRARQNQKIEDAKERIAIAESMEQSGIDPRNEGYDKNRDNNHIRSAERQIELIETIEPLEFLSPQYKEAIKKIKESPELLMNFWQGFETVENNFKTAHPQFWEKKEHDKDFIDNTIQSYNRNGSMSAYRDAALKWLAIQSARQLLSNQIVAPHEPLGNISILFKAPKHNKKPLPETKTQAPQTVISQAKTEVIAAIKRKGLNGNWPKELLRSEIKIMMAELDCTKELAIENFIHLYSVHLTAVMPSRTKENFKANITKTLSGKI